MSWKTTATAAAMLSLLGVSGPRAAAAAPPSDYESDDESGRNGLERVWYPTVDLLVVRPLGLAQLAVGTAMLPLAYPYDLITQAEAEVFDFCVTAPAEFVFTRPLGEF